MSHSDDSLLSAHLDGELDPKRAQALEREVLTNPALAESLESLRAVRGLVSDLSRPVPSDLTLRILDRLQEAPRPDGFWSRARQHRWRAASVAAAISLVVSPWFLRPRPVVERPVAVGAASNMVRPDVSRDLNASPGSSDEVKPDDPAILAVNAVPQPSEPSAKLASERPIEKTGDSLVEAEEGAQVRRLLDDPTLHRVFMVTDRLEQPIESDVTSVIKQSTRHDFYKITVAQGIVIDPEHPGKATVLAVILDESELDVFRGRLTKKIKVPVRETEANPEITLQLVDVGQIVTFASQAAGDVLPATGSDLAFRQTSRHENQEEDSQAAPVVAATGIEREQSRPIPGSEMANRAIVSEARRQADEKSKGDQSQVVLGPPAPVSAAHVKESDLPYEAVRDRFRPLDVPIGERDRPRSDSKHCVVLVWISQPERG